MSATAIDACGKTHKGKVRVGNEDAMLVDAEIGLYAVLDGMGGAKAGEIASGTARDVLGDYVRGNLDRAASRKDLLHAAIHAANAKVHHDAKHHREWRGMGTTVVALLLVDAHSAIIAHVGDSRAYLWRDGRMQLLTRDHTVVTELLRRNMITASEAAHHPHRNVLSRNLGSKPAVKVDLVELSLKPGDRILLCSDGLTGFASSDAIEQILGSHDPVEDTADDLIELAMRGGGRDNITAVVIDTGRAEVPRHTQILRTSGSMAWLQRRELFLEAARRRGLCDSPVCSVLSPDEALEIVAGNLSEAMFHDLEQTSGINVWTYAENLGRGWFDQDGDYEILRELLDILRAAADEVLADIEATGAPYAMSLDIAVTRALIVAEVAIGGLLSERLRAVEAELLELGARKSGRIDTSAVQLFADQPTQPYLKTVRVDPPPPEMQSCLEQALALARDALSHDDAGRDAADCLVRAHQAALEPVGPSDAELSARDLVAARGSDESGITPLLDALDRARIVHLDAIKRLDATPDLRVAALRRVAMAHRRLMYSVASIVVENTQPVTQALHEAAARTAKLRAQVGKGEAELAEIERRQARRKTVPNLSRSQQ